MHKLGTIVVALISSHIDEIYKICFNENLTK